MSEQVDFERLRAEFEALAKERAAAVLDTPRFALGHVCEVAGVSQTQLRNWLNRQSVTLAADQNRQAGKWRYFSGADALRIAAAAQFSRLHLPMDWADYIAGEVVDFFRACLTQPMGTPRNPFWIVQAAKDDSADDGVGINLSGPYYPGGPMGFTSELFAPVGLYVKPLEIGEKVFKALGVNIAHGTADELRARAAEMEANDE